MYALLAHVELPFWLETGLYYINP